MSELMSLQKIWSFNEKLFEKFSCWHITITSCFFAYYVQSGEFWWYIKFWNHSPPQSMTHDKIEKVDVIDWVIDFMKMWVQIDFQTKFHGTTKFCTNTFLKNHRRKSIGDKKNTSLLLLEMMHWNVHQIEETRI